MKKRGEKIAEWSYGVGYMKLSSHLNFNNEITSKTIMDIEGGT